MEEGSLAERAALMNLKNSPAVIAHEEMMQGIINRLSDKCAQCKEWCFALAGALLVFICSVDNDNKIDFNILYFIIGIFCVLDAYYLGLERKMRRHYRTFIDDINKRTPDLYRKLLSPYGLDIKPHPLKRFWSQFTGTLCGFLSFSIIIPYGLMFLVTWLFQPATACSCN